MKTPRIITLALFQYFLFSALISGQNTPPSNIFSLLQQYDPLKVVIETDIKTLKSGGSNPGWQRGVFKIMNKDSVLYEQKIQVTSRGNMRKKTCDFPPVKIRFFEGKLENDSLEDINELKVVVGCRNSNLDDQLVLKECLAYGLFNLLSDESFRVKPASIRFQNPGRKKGVMESTAFFIESELELATRLKGRPIKPRIISPKGLDTVSYDRMCLFQYMIGNTDWGGYTRHNIKIIGFKGRPPIAVPYDFDYSGLVSADYAIASPDVPIQNVQQRYFLGLCRSAASYNALFKEFVAKKSLLLAYCEQFPGLDRGNRQQVKIYLEDFFKLLDDPRRANEQIIENCDKRIRKDDSKD